MSALRRRYRARGWAAGLFAGVVLLALLGAAAAQAAPNEETQLPAGGVTSITRDGHTWTVITTLPAGEIKYMEPGPQQIVCSTNYGNPCTTVETFTAAGDCVYLQLDGIPGENSSDPYVCRGGTSSTSSPVATEPVPTSPAPHPQRRRPLPARLPLHRRRARQASRPHPPRLRAR